MKKLALFFLASYVLIVSTQAQYQVQGTIVENNQQAVPFATIALHLAQDSSLVRGAVSDEEGRFQIPIHSPAGYYLHVQYVGKVPLLTPDFRLDTQTSSIDLGAMVLQDQVETLSDVVITAKKPLVEQHSDRMVLNVENSVITKGNKVNDLLKYAPLVDMDYDGSIKVANNKSVLILVDGRQMGGASLSSFLQNFSAEDILKVEVITNPSARYDASYKSVINIVTKKSLEVGMNGRASLTYSQGALGRFTPDASLNYRTRQLNIYGGLSYNLSHYLNEQHLDRFYPSGAMNNYLEGRQRYEYLASYIGIDFTPSEQHIIGLRLNGNWNQSHGHEQTLTSFLNPAWEVDSLLKTRNSNRAGHDVYDINLNYTGKFKDSGSELIVNLTQTSYQGNGQQNIDYGEVSVKENYQDPATLLRILNKSRQQSFIAQADYTLPFDKARWELGSRYIQVSNGNHLQQEEFINQAYQLNPTLSNQDTYQEHTYAAYSNYSRNLEGDWSLQAGLRAEKTDQTLKISKVTREYFGFFPSAGISKNLKNGKSWGLTYSRKISRPSLSSLVPFRYMIDPYTFAEGNPRLKPQYSNSLDTYFNLGVVSLFANYTLNRDMISPILYGDPNSKIYTQITGNLDHVHAAYLGSSWSDEITSWWQTNTTLMLTGTYVNSPVADVPSFQVDGYGFNFSSTNIFHLPHDWQAELTVNYSSANQWMAWKTGAIYGLSASINKKLWQQGNLRIQFRDILRTQSYRYWIQYGDVDMYSTGYNDNQRVQVSFSYSFGKKTVKGARQRSIGNEDTKSRLGQ